MSEALRDASPSALSEETQEFYRRMMLALNAAEAPFLVGGAYALARYTGIERFTKDFDIFVRPADVPKVEAALAAAGCVIERFSPHWLSKALNGDDFIDIIWSSGNAVATVDDLWFENGPRGKVLGVPVQLCPCEEIIWSKSFIMERERFDGADVNHLIHEQAHRLDWQRLLDRFGDNWRVLLAHLTLFGFVYPQRRVSVPDWVMAELVRRLRIEQREPPPRLAVCRGSLLSRSQYMLDTEMWGYRDGRLPPTGNMTQEQIEAWEQRRREEQGDAPLH